MLELRLFDELEPSQKMAAATVLAGNAGHAVHALEYLMHGCMLAVAGVDSGTVVAAYGLPYFLRDGNTLRNSEFGYIATEPPGKGIGSSMLLSLERIFEAAAYEARAVLVHRTASENSLFLRCGYRGDGTFHEKVEVRSRRYEPKQNLLTEPEQRIVAKLLQSVQMPAF